MAKEYHGSYPSPSRFKYLLVALLYFAEGLPFGLVYVSLPVFLRSKGVDLVKIGLLSLTGLAWTAKPLWAPLVDRFGYKTRWMSGALLGLGGLLAGLSFLPVTHPFYLAMVFLFCLCSATLDIAVDGYTIEILRPQEVGPANGIRVAAYRVALIFSGGILVAISGAVGFKTAFMSLAFILAGLGLLMGSSLFCPCPGKVFPPKRGLLETYWFPLKDLLGRPRPWALILFVLLFKFGDALMGMMIYPFWVDRGFSRAEIGLISGTLGTIFSITGSLIGGWLVKILGLGKALWGLGALQALSNLGYAYAALPGKGKGIVYAASICESFTGGLGTAAFLAFLMRLCRKDVSASQYALLSTLFSLGRTLAGAVSGFGAKHWGYAGFFFFTFWASWPAFLLLPWVLKYHLRPLSFKE